MGRITLYDPSIKLGDSGSVIRPFIRNPDFTTISGADKPWLYTCGLQGPLKLEIPLAPAGSPPRTFRVTLMFCELEAPPARRVFDVLLQSKPVLTGFEILTEAKGPGVPVNKEFTVTASDQLTIELAGPAAPGPLVNAVSIVAQP